MRSSHKTLHVNIQTPAKHLSVCLKTDTLLKKATKKILKTDDWKIVARFSSSQPMKLAISKPHTHFGCESSIERMNDRTRESAQMGDKFQQTQTEQTTNLKTICT